MQKISRASQVALLVEGVGRNSVLVLVTMGALPSPSSWRAWVEIEEVKLDYMTAFAVALLVEGVGRNGSVIACRSKRRRVALLVEGVGRNCPGKDRDYRGGSVALLVEGVGRNRTDPARWNIRATVALLVEGVGRNQPASGARQGPGWSPSSWRAWVEMSIVT